MYFVTFTLKIKSVSPTRSNLDNCEGLFPSKMIPQPRITDMRNYDSFTTPSFYSLHSDDEVIQAQLGNLTDDVLAGLETYAKDHNMTSVDLPDVKQDFTVVSIVWVNSGKMSHPLFWGGVVGCWVSGGNYGEDLGWHLPNYGGKRQFGTLLILVRFSLQPLWILSLTGSVNLTEGSLLNYMELKRYKDSSLIFIPTRDHLVLQTGIAIPNIEVSETVVFLHSSIGPAWLLQREVFQ